MNLSLQKGELLILLAAFGLTLTGTLGQVLILVFCIGSSFLGSSHGIRSLFISFLLFLINPAIAPPLEGLVPLLRIVLLMVVAGRGIYRLIFEQILLKGVFWLSIFCLVVSLLALTSSYSFEVSFSKILQFYLSVVGIITCYFFSKKGAVYWANYVYTFCTLIMLLSLPTIWLPHIGYFRNGFGFQGIVNQPQSYAVLLAPYGALLLGNFFLEKRKGYLEFIIIVVFIINLFLTRGRTGVISILLGLIALSVVGILRKNRLKKLINLVMRPSNYLYAVCLLSLFLFFKGSIMEGVRGFILKNEEKSGNLERSFDNSRGFLILMQLKNIREHPMTGIGFGLPSQRRELRVVRDPVFNLAVSAPTEKGIFFISIVEEIGILGTIFFVFLIYYLLVVSTANSVVSIKWMALTAFFTNIGEATLFSLGGMGLFVWLCMITGIFMCRKLQNPSLCGAGIMK